MQKIILDLIKIKGFITLDDFIFQAMCHGKHGYYSKQNPIMSDFVTSPEITDAFGITLASHIIDRLLNLEYILDVEKINFCEFGGGTGKLAFDILNFIIKLDKLNNIKINHIISKIHFNSIEFSKILREIQRNKLINLNIPTHFFTNIDEFFENNDNSINNKKYITVFFSNEFFDALPIKQFIFNNNELCEIIVIEKNNELMFSRIKINKNNILNNYFNFDHIPENSIVEFPNIGINILENIINFIKKNNNSIFLTFDYGFIKNNYQNTLQGIYKNKKIKNIMQNIGDSDITHLVNFELFKNLFEKNNLNSKIQTQEEFLIANGINYLTNSGNKDGINRILSKNQMGDLFKMLYCENL